MRLHPALPILLLLCATLVRAQFRFDHWTTEDGLPQNSVQSVTQTPDGFIWFPTLDGLVRFDGVSFKIFNTANSPGLTSNRLRVITNEDDGTLWIAGEQNGVVRYRDGVFRTITTADGLPANEVFGVGRNPGGGIQIFTTKGTFLTRDSGESFERAREPDDASRLSYVAPSGTTWLMDTERIERRGADGDSASFALPERIVASGKNYPGQARLYEDPNDRSLWLSFLDELFHLSGNRFLSAGKTPSDIRSIIRDGHGNLWTGTANSGVCRHTGNGFDCFGTNRGLSTNAVYDLFVDREKTLWITTENGGINRLTPRVVESFGVREGLAAQNVYPILEDSRGDLWIGSYGGLTRRSADGRIVVLDKEHGVEPNLITSIFEDRDGVVWVGAINAIYKMHGERAEQILDPAKGFPRGTYYAIEQTADGAMWFGTDVGVLRFDGVRAEVFTTEQGLPGVDAQLVRRLRDGTLVVGTTKGAAKLADGRFVPLAVNDATRGLAVRELYEDEDGFLWFGTYDHGLALYRNGEFRLMTTADGLFSNGVFRILPDARGNFWISSNQGIYRVGRREILDYADGRTTSFSSTAFGASDGMTTIECNGGRQPAGVRARDGKMWFPTQNGVAIVDPEAVPFNPLPPPVVIDAALIENQPQTTRETGLVIEPGRGNVTIKYAGLSFIKPEQVRFRYMLEGLDTAWTEAGTRREAYYPYLPPGNYRFRVISANSDNVWNETGATLEIEVRPPFYRRLWFLTLISIAVGAFVFLIFQRRIWKLERERAARQAFSRQLIASQEMERQRIAAELHDSLGQRLVVIKNLALMYLRKGAAGNLKQIEAISTEASDAIGEVTEISYNLRPYQLDRIGLTKAVEGIVESARAASEIEFSFEIDNIDEYFPKESEINFYRIVQESVSNAVKHSGATTARLTVTRNDDFVDFELADNGRGFVPYVTESKTGGFGLLGIGERAALFGGRVELKSAPGAGTTISIRLYRK